MKKNTHSGFSLIEMLIVIAIIIMASTTSFAFYNTYTNKKKLEGEAESLVTVLELAKKKAAAASMDSNLDCGSDDFGGYQVIIENTDYQLDLLCIDPNTQKPYVKGVVHTYPFDSLTAVVSTSPSSSVIFQPLSAGATSTTIRLRNRAVSGECRDITVQQTGLIDEQKVSC